MARVSRDAVRHVVSFRVSDSEREALEEIADKFGVNISTLLRRGLKLLEEAYVNGDQSEEEADRRSSSSGSATG